jgi:hypothetical protein
MASMVPCRPTRVAWREFEDHEARSPHRRRLCNRTSGTPVTNFKHSTKKYKKAMRHNSDLDRDKDGIACEKR